MTEKRATLSLTPAQMRSVNSALALLEAEVEAGYDVHTAQLNVLRRTRHIVWDAMRKASIQP